MSYRNFWKRNLQDLWGIEVPTYVGVSTYVNYLELVVPMINR